MVWVDPNMNQIFGTGGLKRPYTAAYRAELKPVELLLSHIAG